MRPPVGPIGPIGALLAGLAALLFLAGGCAGPPVKAGPSVKAAPPVKAASQAGPQPRAKAETPAVRVEPAPKAAEPVAPAGKPGEAPPARLPDPIDRILDQLEPKPEAPPVPPSFVPLGAEDIPELMDDADPATLRQAVERSLAYYDRVPNGRSYRVADRTVTAAEMKASLAAFLEIMNGEGGPEEKFRRLRDRFDFYRSVGADGRGRVTVTGYYEPILEGSLTRTERFKHPLYRTPEETVTVDLGRFGKRFGRERLVGRLQNGEVVPHYRRFEIDRDGVLAGRNLEIVWVDDPVDLFYLHVQGPGIIRLPDGRTLRVNYAQRNGWPFRGLARYLYERGKISASEMSHQGIVAYLRAHPEEAGDIMNYNESYVFFRQVDEGPIGALGFPVTDGRSIAVDLDVFPRGALAFLQARKPRFDAEGNLTSWEPLNRFVLVQDTGGVFKGPGKADLFCGTGPEAGRIAGSMKEAGRVYLLILKDASAP